MRKAGRGPRTDPRGIHYNILSTVCEVVSNPLHKIDIQANGLQFFNLGLWGTESNALVKLKITAAASIPDSIISSQSFVAVKSACIVDFPEQNPH